MFRDYFKPPSWGLHQSKKQPRWYAFLHNRQSQLLGKRFFSSPNETPHRSRHKSRIWHLHGSDLQPTGHNIKFRQNLARVHFLAGVRERRRRAIQNEWCRRSRRTSCFAKHWWALSWILARRRTILRMWAIGQRPRNWLCWYNLCYAGSLQTRRLQRYLKMTSGFALVFLNVSTGAFVCSKPWFVVTATTATGGLFLQRL